MMRLIACCSAPAVCVCNSPLLLHTYARTPVLTLQAAYWQEQLAPRRNEWIVYGNDVEGSAFSTAPHDPLGASPWNLQVGFHAPSLCMFASTQRSHPHVELPLHGWPPPCCTLAPVGALWTRAAARTLRPFRRPQCLSKAPGSLLRSLEGAIPGVTEPML